MSASHHSYISQHIEMVLPVKKVLGQAFNFLEQCAWELEVGDEVVVVPRATELIVRSRAFIKADVDDVFLGDHFEAVVLIGKIIIGDNIRAEYGVLRMYFNLDGQFVSEDRFDRYK